MNLIKRTLSSSLLAFALFSAASNATAANLLINGSFEQPGCADSCVLDTPQKTNFITGWTTFLSGAEYFNPAASIRGAAAADGNVIVDLANSIYGNGGGIQQNFATDVGAKYRLTFSAGNSAYANRSGEGVVQVKVAGQTATFNTPAAHSQAFTWGTFTYEFTATTALTTLAFSNEQNPYVNFAFIDNVIVERL
ncbi:DUF642 domain-containing protein [Pseudomonas sp. B21-056]|jgi:hypothetical protein|uniref:DUF642 domain-containing protein n=1 Tax=Pseudomonas sp. B21-056 TaxID=2895495 RepID=UPI00223023D5|nr:DUF642 domain-containing protein [Pseudomonas sp. B21-056]UZE24904.1 DUF642 domain-containing protein [Pseudomonas sp. B21-056]